MRGAVAAELVVATPLLLVLVASVVQFALWQLAGHVVTAAQEGAGAPCAWLSGPITRRSCQCRAAVVPRAIAGTVKASDLPRSLAVEAAHPHQVRRAGQTTERGVDAHDLRTGAGQPGGMEGVAHPAWSPSADSTTAGRWDVGHAGS